MPQLTGVGCFTHQVQFVKNRLLILPDHFQGSQSPPFFPITLREAGDNVQQFYVAANHLLNGWTQHLDHDFAPVQQPGGVNLGNGGGSQRLGAKFSKHRVQRLAISLLNNGPRLLTGERRHPILQLGQFQRDVIRH